MKLLYRGEKYLDESFPDYLMRLAYWNGFRDLKTFSKKLKGIYKSHYINTDPVEAAKNNISITADRGFYWCEYRHRDLGWLKCKYALEIVLKRNFYSEEMNLSSETHGKKLYQVNICRACWEEIPYVRFYWRMYSYSLCHKHEAELESVEMISYHPNVERIGLLKSRPTRFTVRSYWTIRKLLEVTRDTEFNLRRLSTETDNSADDLKLWPKVVSFLQVRFRIKFQFSNVDEILEANDLCGLDPLARLELVIKMLADKSDASKDLVKIATLIFLRKFRLYEYRVTNFKTWARAQAYSVSPLFEAYMFGVYANLFHRNPRFDQEIINPIYFLDFSDRMICQFIIDSGILSDSELKDLYIEGKYDVDGWSGPSDSIPKHHKKYLDYIEVVGENVFDGDPLPRNQLEL